MREPEKKNEAARFALSDKDEKAGGLCITLRPNRESFEIVTRTANLGKDEKTAKDMTDLLVLLEVLDNIRPFSNGFLGENWREELPERNREEAVVCDIHQGDKLGQNFAVVFLKTDLREPELEDWKKLAGKIIRKFF